MKNLSQRSAVLVALFVTFLWSTSWVLIKLGLKEMPALTFAGLRYTLAFACLLPFALTPPNRAALRALTRGDWARLVLLGVLYYAVTQGTQYVGLKYLPAATASLILNLTSMVVLGLGVAFLRETPGWMQGLGILINLIGVVIYFYPVGFASDQWLGVVFMAVGMTTNAIGTVLARGINRAGNIPPIIVTVVGMGVGAALMLTAGLLTEGGMPAMSGGAWLNVAWMAVVNTALAFTLWNRTMRTLAAAETAMINNTMLVQIAVLAWVFLGEGLGGKEIFGLLLAAAGAILAQIRSKPAAAAVNPQSGT